MNDTDRKLLTEYLGECWHEFHREHPNKHYCSKCVSTASNRTFFAEADMMALYRRIAEKGEWEEFCKVMIGEWESKNNYVDLEISEFTAWLFCLSGEGYEERCQMVAEFLKRRKE